MRLPSQPTAILHNARIYTLDEHQPIASALVLDGPSIVALGDDDVLNLARSQTTCIDLNGRTVLPGLIDAHIHLEKYAHSLQQIDCEALALDECLQQVHSHSLALPSGEWILGHGWNQNPWGKYGTSTDLDRVSPAHPVYLTAKSLHSAWCNSLALQVAGIGPQTPDPPGGKIQRDVTGQPTGILLENAMKLVSKRIPPLDPQYLSRFILQAQERLWRFGLTGLHDYDGSRCLAALRILHGEGQLGIRVLKSIHRDDFDEALAEGIQTGAGDVWLNTGNLKLLADGALGQRTAATFDPYPSEPDNLGILLLDEDRIRDIALRATRARIGLSIHAIGDRANHIALNVFHVIRRFEQDNRLTRLRHRVEHMQLLSPHDVPVPARLGLIASMQPVHATSDMTMAQRHWGARTKLAYAWRSQLDHGTILAFGSDAPVESPNPFLGLHAAVTRRRLDGSPGPHGWIPEQRISLSDALRAYTTGPSYAAASEGHLGRLAPGYLADLIVLEQDPFSVAPQALPQLAPVGTMTGGVWRHREFA